MPWSPTGRTALITIRRTPQTREALHALAADRGMPLTELFDEAVALLVDRYKLEPRAHKAR